MYPMPVEVLAEIFNSERRAFQLHCSVEYTRALASIIFLGKVKENTLPTFVWKSS